MEENYIQWIFNPPLSPHFGGVFEVMIKAAKKAMDVIIRRASLHDEELMSVFIEIEGIMNSRPICAISKDIKDETVLTPNHFLLGHAIGYEDGNSMRQRWKLTQEIAQHYWKRVRKEILMRWRERHKLKLENTSDQEFEAVLATWKGALK